MGTTGGLSYQYEIIFVDNKRYYVAGCSRTEIAIDVLSLMFSLVQNMGALTAIYCHSEENGLGMSLASTFLRRFHEFGTVNFARHASAKADRSRGSANTGIGFPPPPPMPYTFPFAALSRPGTGVVMSVQHVASVVFAPICGHFLDNTRHKRLAITFAFLLTASTYLGLAQFKSFGAVISVLMLQSATSGMYMPGITSLGLGLVGKQGFAKRATRTEMYRHLGGVMAGILPMVLVPRIGFCVYFYVCVSMACFAALTTLLIDDSIIDHAAACGSDDYDSSELSSSGSFGLAGTDLVPYRQLLCRRQIMLIIASVVLFHVGNAAMLPMTGQKIDDLAHNNDTWLEIPGIGWVDGAVGVSISQVIAECAAVPFVFLVGGLANRGGWGRRRVAMIGFAALPLRGLLLGITNSIEGLLCIQLLHGFSIAIAGVVPILMMQDLTQGTGRFSSMQGSVAASMDFGSAVSQLIAGWLADLAGFSIMFYTLSGIGGLALLCIVVMKETKPGWTNSNIDV